MINNRSEIKVFWFMFFSALTIPVLSFFKVEVSNLKGFIDGWHIYWIVRILAIVLFVFFLTKANFYIDVGPFKAPADEFSELRRLYDPLLGLRALACLNVIMGHWFLVTFGPAAPAVSHVDLILRYALSFSPWCGVWMFFTLSGYLMGKGFIFGRYRFSGRDLRKFYANRSLRILPIYIVMIFLVAVFINPFSLDFRFSSFSSFENLWLGTVTFDHFDGALIGALWSVATEVQFYLLAPFICLFFVLILNRLRYAFCFFY